MTNDELIKEITALPSEAKRQIERFVSLLKKRHHGRTDPLMPLAEEDFVGMWADREDMTDSSAWVRNAREANWNR